MNNFSLCSNYSFYEQKIKVQFQKHQFNDLYDIYGFYILRSNFFYFHNYPKKNSMKRPKSAVLMSIPREYLSSVDPLTLKQKVKDCFVTDYNYFNEPNFQEPFVKTFQDKGPSLLSKYSQSYSQSSIRRQQQRKLKPCKSLIRKKSLKHWIDQAKYQNSIIDNILKNTTYNQYNCQVTNVLKTIDNRLEKKNKKLRELKKKSPKLFMLN